MSPLIEGADRPRFETIPRREAKLEIAEFEDSMVVFDQRTNSVHLLDALSAVIFDACDGLTTRVDLIDEIHTVLGDSISMSMAADHVDHALRDFVDLGLLEGFPPIGEPPCVGCGEAQPPKISARISRRVSGRRAIGRRSRG